MDYLPGVDLFLRTLIKVLIGLLGTLSACGQFRSTQWNADSGLPQNSVRGIVRTPDGYIWVATLNGAARFDGVRFTIFDKSNTPGISSNRFVAMAQGQGGDFCLLQKMEISSGYHDRRFRTLGPSDGIRAGSISSVTSNDDGSIWIASDETLYRWNALTNRFDKQQLAEDGVHFRPLWWIGTGFWALHDNQFLYLLHGVFHRSILPSWIVRAGIKTAAVEGDGTIWMALANGGFLRIRDGRYRRLDQSFEVPLQEGRQAGLDAHIHKDLGRFVSSSSRIARS